MSLQRKASRSNDLVLHTQFPLLLSNAIVTLLYGVNAEEPSSPSGSLLPPPLQSSFLSLGPKNCFQQLLIAQRALELNVEGQSGSWGMVPGVAGAGGPFTLCYAMLHNGMLCYAKCFSSGAEATGDAGGGR